MTDKDPLDHADIGRTETIRSSKTVNLINYTPDVYFGSDRILGDLEVDGIELVEADDGGQDIKVTWEGEVTKRLPRNWDKHNVPITEGEKKAARLKKWKQGLMTPVMTFLGVIASMLGAFWMMNAMAGEVVVNGEPLPPPSLGTMMFMFVVIMIIYLIVVWGARGAIPRKI